MASKRQSSSTGMYDVILTGGGPVGLSLGIYLAELGHRVLILEATDLKRNSPRAIALNGESQRLLIQKLGLGEGWAKNSLPVSACKGPLGRFHFVTSFPNPQALDTDPNAAVDISKANPIVRETAYMPGPSGHNDATFFQPELMAFLYSRVASFPNLELRLETKLVDFIEEKDAHGRTIVRAVCQPTKTEWERVKGGEWLAKDILNTYDEGEIQYSIPCHYLVGCDGVRSRVREIIMGRTSITELDNRAAEADMRFDAAVEQQGAAADGIGVVRRGNRMSVTYTDIRICIDVEVLREEIIGTKLAPHFLQTCDPKLPATIIPSAWVTTEGFSGGRHWRFEILLMDETVDAEELLKDEDARYAIISPYVSREDVRIIRAAVYYPTAGQSLKWRLGHAFLAGDSAHNTPPWLGQGLNQGFNDILNLTWKLDLCIRGLATDSLLDSYEQERMPNNTRQLVASCRLGAAVRRFSKLAADTAGDYAAFRKGFDSMQEELRKHPFALFTKPLDGPMILCLAGGQSCRATLKLPGVVEGSSEWLGKILNQPMDVPVATSARGGKAPLDDLLGNGFVLLTVGELQPTAPTLDKLRMLRSMHYQVPPEIVPQLGDLFANGVVAVLVRPDHVVAGTAKNTKEAEVMVSALDRLLGTSETLEKTRGKALIVGTGAAYGNHYTTEQMKTFFKQQREAAGDTEFDSAFAGRVLDACGFDFHSVCLPEKDVFRKMSRSEYLEHRMTNLLEMAARAAEEAIKMWGGNREDITHLYWGTMTGAMHSPTIDIHLVKRLGLNKDVARTSIEGMGCLTGYRLLNLGRETALSDPNARILCLEGDLRSAIGNSLPAKASKVDIVSSSLFRDAASAAIVSGAAVKENEKVYYEMVCGMSRIVPDSGHYVDYRELDCGGIRLHLDKGLPAAVGRAEPAFAKALIDKARSLGLDCADLKDMDIACHTGGPRVLQEVAQASGVGEEALASSYAVMTQHGNLSGASNMAVLDHHNHGCMDEEDDNKWVLCISMGPGVCIEGALLRRINPVEEQIAAATTSGRQSTRRATYIDAGAGLKTRKSTFKEMTDAWDKVAPEFGTSG